VGGIWGAHRSKKWEPKTTFEQRKSQAAQGGLRGEESMMVEPKDETRLESREHTEHTENNGHVDRIA
jgi:hypothetical protein